MSLRRPEDMHEVYQIMLATNPHGKNNKQVAMEVRPDLNEKQAQEFLSKCLSLFGDRNFKPSEFERFVDACGNAEVLIHYLCDRYSFERPGRRLQLSPEKENKLVREFLQEKGLERKFEDFIDEHKRIISLEIKREKEAR